MNLKMIYLYNLHFHLITYNHIVEARQVNQSYIVEHTNCRFRDINQC